MAKPRPKKEETYGVDSVKRNNKPIIISAVGVVAVLAIIALIVGLTNKDDEPGVKGTAAPYQPVATVGQPLPPQPKDASQGDNVSGNLAPDLQGKTFTGDPYVIKAADGRAKMV